jgi:hypothetical protein
MKQFLSALLVFICIITLTGCGDEPIPTTTTVPLPTTTSGPVHCHSYRDADCVTPKTCTDCGATRGEALGHDYNEGICTRCGDEDSSYTPLLDGNWRADAVNENGSQLEYISLRFYEDGIAYFGAGVYDRLSDVPEAERDDFMLNEENWYDYSGEIYYYAGFGIGDELVYSVEGNIITCELHRDDTVAGTLILERTAGNMLTVTYFEGAFSIIYLQVGDVLFAQI